MRRSSLDAIETLAAATRRRHALPSPSRDLQSRCGRRRSANGSPTGRIDLFAFNDHTENTVTLLNKPNKRKTHGRAHRALGRGLRRAGAARTVPRRRGAGVDRAAGRDRARSPTSACSRMTTTARRCGRRFARRASTIAEFPINEETAREAAAGGDAIVYGAPNVVRGGSHTGWTKASDMIAKGLCSVLASDYYYPAPLLAAFRLAADKVLPLGKAWDLISAAPAKAAGLADRGRLAQGPARRHPACRRHAAAAPAHRRGDRQRPPRASHRRLPPRSPHARRRAEAIAAE